LTLTAGAVGSGSCLVKLLLLAWQPWASAAVSFVVWVLVFVLQGILFLPLVLFGQVQACKMACLWTEQVPVAFPVATS
jgi:hypothetical protein